MTVLQLLNSPTLISRKIWVTENHEISTLYMIFNFCRYKIKLGRHFVEDSEDRNAGMYEYNIEKFVIHPNFNKRHLTNDVALVWLKSKYGQPVLWTDYVLPICLPKSTDEFLNQPNTEGTGKSTQCGTLMIFLTL